jgi:hypothetical protein
MWYRYPCLLLCTANIFSIYVFPKKDLAKPHYQISTKYCSYSAFSNGNNIFLNRNYEIKVNLMEEIYISRLELQRWSPEFVIIFSKIYIVGVWDWDLANSFCDHVIQISFRVMNFQDIHSQQWKVLFFFGTIDSLNSYLRRTVMYVQYWFLFLILTRPKVTVRTCRNDYKKI